MGWTGSSEAFSLGFVFGAMSYATTLTGFCLYRAIRLGNAMLCVEVRVSYWLASCTFYNGLVRLCKVRSNERLHL
jgi:hypothetical protein